MDKRKLSYVIKPQFPHPKELIKKKEKKPNNQKKVERIICAKNKNKEKVRGKKLENIFLNTYFDEVFSDPSVVSTSLLPSKKVKYCNF